MAPLKSVKNSQLKEHLERTYGKGAFVARSWLAKETGKSKRGKSNKLRKKHKVMVSPQGVPETELKTYVESAGETLQDIRKDIGDCTRCKLCEKRTNIVFGEGDPKAELMFVGEGPGENEDLQGRPFVGRAGQLLDKIIEAMGLKRSEVYIANVVKCRPPNNRQPELDEAMTCRPFLFRQIECIRPKVIVALGSTALQYLLNKDAKISKLRGTFTEYKVDGVTVKFMPTFHPAYLLRNPPAKKDVWEDMKKVMKELGLKETGN